MASKVEFLGVVPLFEGLGQEDLERVAEATRVVSFESGEPIVEIGEPGRSLYVVVSGNVQVFYPARTSEFELARLGPGDFFGEMALLNDKPRSATVRALGAVQALVLDKGDFRNLVVDRPEVALKVLEVLSVRIRVADQQISGLSDQASHDPLTGLLNRRSFNERMLIECDRTRRYGTEFSLILIDLDHFRSINETLGHETGDEVLRWIGRLLTEHTRISDMPFRLGGEEFAVICPSTTSDCAHIVAERLVGLVGEASPPVDHELHVTMSAAHSSCPQNGGTMKELVEVADRALYAAKRDGRNRVHGPAA